MFSCSSFSTALVAPFAGAWIEIVVFFCQFSLYFVAPFAGAWIEITIPLMVSYLFLSLPSRERGLKSFCPHFSLASSSVAPFAGAWIEIGVSRL